MSEKSIDVSLHLDDDNSIGVLIEAPEFVADEGGFESIEDALEWIRLRFTQSDDPFKPTR